MSDYRVEPYAITLLSRDIDAGMSLEEREHLLMGEMSDLYVEVTRYFEGTA